MNQLEMARGKIDQIDKELVELLEKRLEAVAQVVQYKIVHQLPVLDNKRQEDLLEKIAYSINNKTYQETILETFKDIMKHSREFQNKQMEG